MRVHAPEEGPAVPVLVGFGSRRQRDPRSSRSPGRHPREQHFEKSGLRGPEGMTHLAGRGTVGGDFEPRKEPTMRQPQRSPLLLALAPLALAASAAAQSAPELPQASPLARVEQRVGLTDFAVEYSSPGAKERVIWGELVPYGELWRTGANAPTKLEASRDFSFGGKPVPAGTYALLTIPEKKAWTVILNRDTKLLGGTRGYDQKDDAARVTVEPDSAPMRERLVFLFSDTTDDSTRLDLEWEKLRLSVPITVATRAQAMDNIDKTLAEAWRPHMASARWLLDNGGDLGQALGYADTSIAIKPTWWNNWVKAQILAKQGKTADAVAAAERAQELGKDDQVFSQFFAAQVSKAITDWKKKS
jgi:hypothetical protein